jgi:hypothetical protein
MGRCLIDPKEGTRRSRSFFSWFIPFSYLSPGIAPPAEACRGNAMPRDRKAWVKPEDAERGNMKIKIVSGRSSSSLRKKLPKIKEIHVVQLPYYSFGSHKIAYAVAHKHGRPTCYQSKGDTTGHVFINCAAKQLKDQFVKYTKKLTRGRVKAKVKTSTVQNIELEKTVVSKFKQHFDESDRDSDDSSGGDDSKSDKSSKSSKSGSGSDSDDGSNDDSERGKPSSDDVRSPAARCPLATHPRAPASHACRPPSTDTHPACKQDAQEAADARFADSVDKEEATKEAARLLASDPNFQAQLLAQLAAARTASDVVDVTGDASSSAKPQVRVKKEASESASPPASPGPRKRAKDQVRLVDDEAEPSTSTRPKRAARATRK